MPSTVEELWPDGPPASAVGAGGGSPIFSLEEKALQIYAPNEAGGVNMTVVYRMPFTVYGLDLESWLADDLWQSGRELNWLGLADE